MICLGGKVYFSADTNPKIKSSEKVYEGLRGTITTKDILELNFVGIRQNKLVSLQGQGRYERVSAGQFWHFIWGKSLARESLQGCGMTSMPVFSVWSKHPMPSVPEPRGRPWPSGPNPPHPLSPYFALSSNPSTGRVCQLIHSHKLIPN